MASTVFITSSPRITVIHSLTRMLQQSRECYDHSTLLHKFNVSLPIPLPSTGDQPVRLNLLLSSLMLARIHSTISFLTSIVIHCSSLIVVQWMRSKRSIVSCMQEGIVLPLLIPVWLQSSLSHLFSCSKLYRTKTS